MPIVLFAASVILAAISPGVPDDTPDGSRTSLTPIEADAEAPASAKRVKPPRVVTAGRTGGPVLEQDPTPKSNPSPFEPATCTLSIEKPGISFESVDDSMLPGRTSACVTGETAPGLPMPESSNPQGFAVATWTLPSEESGKPHEPIKGVKRPQAVFTVDFGESNPEQGEIRTSCATGFKLAAFALPSKPSRTSCALVDHSMPLCRSDVALPDTADPWHSVTQRSEPQPFGLTADWSSDEPCSKDGPQEPDFQVQVPVLVSYSLFRDRSLLPIEQPSRSEVPVDETAAPCQVGARQVDEPSQDQVVVEPSSPLRLDLVTYTLPVEPAPQAPASIDHPMPSCMGAACMAGRIASVSNPQQFDLATWVLPNDPSASSSASLGSSTPRISPAQTGLELGRPQEQSPAGFDLGCLAEQAGLWGPANFIPTPGVSRNELAFPAVDLRIGDRPASPEQDSDSPEQPIRLATPPLWPVRLQ